MNLLIMGLPGAGEGTQAAKVVKKFGVARISIKDMFHAAMINKTEMGILAKSFISKGELVPDEVTNGTVRERLARDDIVERGLLLDGYPRTIEQAHALDETLSNLDLKLDGVISIEINPESLIECSSDRIINRKTGETFHKIFNPPVGDYNEDDFYQHKDNKPETVERHLNANITRGAPVIEHYRKAGIVFDVQGNQGIDGVFADIVKVISPLK